MADTTIDWAEVLTHTRMRVREVGLTEIDVRVTMDFRTSQSPSNDFRKYLDSIINALGESSSSGYERAMKLLRECLKTESGGPIQGIEVGVDDRDFGVYRTESIQLGEQRDLTALLTELKQLRHELESSGIFNENSSA